jgi:hypothetical protein
MIENVIDAINKLATDRFVPKTVRRACNECLEALETKEDISIGINTCIAVLDEVSNDPNVPSYARTQIWNILSMLEAVNVEEINTSPN